MILYQKDILISILKPKGRWDITDQEIMKRLFLLCSIYAFVFSVSAQYTCEIYNTTNAKATLETKGDKTNSGGVLSIIVNVDNYSEKNNENRSVIVWIEIRDRITGCVVERVKVPVSIPKYSSSGRGFVTIGGLQPNTDYLFNIDNAVTCK